MALKALALALVIAGAPLAAGAQTVRYGANPAAAKTFVHDGVTFYYETYGSGPPLLLVHGNGGSIASLRAQIDGFRGKYRVIAMDSRDRGRTGTAPAR